MSMFSDNNEQLINFKISQYDRASKIMKYIAENPYDFTIHEANAVKFVNEQSWQHATELLHDSLINDLKNQLTPKKWTMQWCKFQLAKWKSYLTQ